MSDIIEGGSRVYIDRGIQTEPRSQTPLAVISEMDSIYWELGGKVDTAETFGYRQFLSGLMQGMRESLTGWRGKESPRGAVWVKPSRYVALALTRAEEDLARALEGHHSTDFVAGRVAGLEWVLGQRESLDRPGIR